jgi:hypothetical protein
MRPAKIAGLIAALWALLAPLLLFLPIYEGTGTAKSTNAMDADKFAEAIGVLGATCALGITGLAGLMLLARGNQKGKWMTGGAAVALLMLSAFTAKTTGPFLFPPGLLFVAPTLWLEPLKRR